MALQQDLLKIERTLWTGGPEAYRAATDDPTDRANLNQSSNRNVDRQSYSL